MAGSQREATEAEIRLAVGEPESDIGHIDTVLEALNQACYFLNSERRRFRFSVSPNLNKLLADRRGNIQPQKIDERIRAEIKKAFPKEGGVEIKAFVEESGHVPDRPGRCWECCRPTGRWRTRRRPRSMLTQ